MMIITGQIAVAVIAVAVPATTVFGLFIAEPGRDLVAGAVDPVAVPIAICSVPAFGGSGSG